MENNSNTPTKQSLKNPNSIISIAAIVLFMALILAPVLLLLTTGEDKTELDGEKQYEAPKFSISDFLSSDFQSNFELWFSTKYPMRGSFVSAYRRLQFDTSNIGFDISMIFANTGTKPPLETAPIPEGDPSNTPPETTEPEPLYSDFNELYAEMNRRLYERTPVESAGYKGTDQVVIGKSGYCYENGYINELYGYTQKYRDCSDEYIAERVETLSYIQKRLGEMGIKFALIVTPSKASEYEQYIPDWYKASYTAPDNYTRPVDKLRDALAETDVNFIDCAALYDEIGLDETFPLTGIHWNKPAALEATAAIIDKFEEISDEGVRNLKVDRIIEIDHPSGFGNGEQDIFSIAYSGLSTKNAIKDDKYYLPSVGIEREDGDKRINLLLQGGSFCWDFKYYLEDNGIINRLTQFYYNHLHGNDAADPARVGDDIWEKLLKKIDYVVFECNEQFVCTMGADAPRWGNADREPVNTRAFDVYKSLYNYLKSAE